MKPLRILALFALAALLGLTAHVWNPYTKAVTKAANAGCVTDTECQQMFGGDGYGGIPAEFTIDAYEDGSGVLYKGEQEIATFDSDFFLWDCTENGNGICGEGWDEYANVVQGHHCQEFVVANNPARNLGSDLSFTYCTDGDLDWHVADDVDVEGEVV